MVRDCVPLPQLCCAPSVSFQVLGRRSACLRTACLPTVVSTFRTPFGVMVRDCVRREGLGLNFRSR